MKTTIIARTLFFFLLVSFKITDAQTQSKEEVLGVNVLEALMANNFSLMEGSLATMSDFEEYIEKVASYLPAEKQKELVANKNEHAKSAIRALRESFNSVYLEGVEAGIDWAKVKYKSISSQQVGEHPMPKDFATAITITFTYLGIEYQVDAFVINVKRGLVFADKFKFH